VKPVNFYEVQSMDGSVEWGGASALQAVEWYKRTLSARVFVSVWDEEDIEEPHLLIDKIDVTKLIEATLYVEGENA
jgi:hypothetical protein